MTRLTNKQLAYACRQAKKGMEGLPHETPGQLAALWGVTPRWVRKIQQEYRETGVVRKRNPNRRPRDPPLSPEQEHAIQAARKETRRGVVKMWRWLEKQGMPIPKNKVEAYAKAKGWQKANVNKKKKRTRTRYERPYTGDLVHGDWHRTTENHPYMIAWLDDASRRVQGFGEFERLSGDASIATFQGAQKELAHIGVRVKQANTDKGSEFYANAQKDKKHGVSEFTKYLESQGILHIPSRTNNPQTNGKLERFWYEYDQHRWEFDSLAEFIAWYNRQIHEELWIDRDLGIWETPDEAFIRKLPPETLVRLHERRVNGTKDRLTVRSIYGN